MNYLFLIFLVILPIYFVVINSLFDIRKMANVIYEDMLLRALDRKEIEVVRIKNVSGSTFMRAMRRKLVFLAEVKTRRNRKITGLFFVGHSSFGLLCGHVRFKHCPDTTWNDSGSISQ